MKTYLQNSINKFVKRNRYETPSNMIIENKKPIVLSTCGTHITTSTAEYHDFSNTSFDKTTELIKK